MRAYLKQHGEIVAGRHIELIIKDTTGPSPEIAKRLAQGELLLFLDADTTLEPLALRIIAQNFSKTDAAGTLKGRPDSHQAEYLLIYAIKNWIWRLRL